MSVTGLVLIVYMAGLLGVGFWASRRAATQEDFLLGGRSIGPVVAGLAYAASTSSAWVLLGFTGFVATVGVSALWITPGVIAGYAAVWLWMGPYLNAVSRRRGFLTALDVIAADAGPATRAVKATAALMIMFCFAFYIAAQFQGAGAALSEAFAIERRTAVVAGAAVILAYTFLGGFWAVSLTDTVQGAAILLIAIVLPLAAASAAGGLSGVAAAVADQPGAFDAPFGAYAGWSAFGFFIGISAVGFGAMGQPHLLTWVMAVKDDAARLQGAAVAIGWGVLVYAGMAVIALSARALAEPGAPLGERIVFDMAQTALPGLLPALVAAAILSAIMSTVDSQLLVASATASHDLGLARAAPGR
ncbi:MAG: sodium/proline symporter, partial [Pseudomonadota bacterium]